MAYLKIENFKCFYDAKIPLNELTILAGANGNGKSTVVQALLYLRRTVEHCAKWENNKYFLDEPNGLNVELNGPYCLSLGNSSGLIPKKSNRNTILLGIFNEKMELSIEYDTSTGDLWLTPIKVNNTSRMGFSFFEQEFYYLNAERIGPRISQSINFYDFPNAGFQGEYVAQLISDTQTNYKFEVEENRRNKGSKSPRLEQQVNAWLNELMPGVSITATYNPETHSAQVKVDNYFTKGDATIAPNIGFGISYVLPIIVTGLIAKKGTICIIENPEAHLHPSAQSKIGGFLAMVANAGVKVVVETHSDHLVNGVQIACAKNDISPSAVTINFFSQKEDLRQPDIESIGIKPNGELTNWPRGFFDQSQIDFAHLFKYRKG
jgi:predicted ATPase